MLFLEGQSKPVDDGTQDFQQFRHSVVALRLVHEPVEYVVDLCQNKDDEARYNNVEIERRLTCFLMKARSPKNLP